MGARPKTINENRKATTFRYRDYAGNPEVRQFAGTFCILLYVYGLLIYTQQKSTHSNSVH